MYNRLELIVSYTFLSKYTDRRSSSGSSPSNSPKLSDRRAPVQEENARHIRSHIFSENSNFNCLSPGSPNLNNGKISPKVPSSLATKSQNLEGSLNLVAPIAVTEELDGDDCGTESESNEGR